MAKQHFREDQEVLAKNFELRIEAGSCDEELGAIIIEFILERERLRRDVVAPGRDRDTVDRQTMAALANPDKLGPEHSLLEAVFRRLADDPAKGWKYLQADALRRSKTQASRAKKPRLGRRDSITRAIEEILKEEPELTAKAVGRKLAAHPDIQLLDGEYRNIHDAAAMAETSLKDRVSDAKKRLSG